MIVWARFANAGYLLDSRNTFFCTKQRTHFVINILQQMIFSIRSLHDDLNGGSLDSLCLDNSGFVEDCIISLKERLMNDSLLIIMIYVLIMSRTSYISIINVIIMVLSTSSYNSGKINFLKCSVNEHASMKIKYKVFRINEKNHIWGTVRGLC